MQNLAPAGKYKRRRVRVQCVWSANSYLVRCGKEVGGKQYEVYAASPNIFAWHVLAHVPDTVIRTLSSGCILNTFICSFEICKRLAKTAVSNSTLSAVDASYIMSAYEYIDSYVINLSAFITIFFHSLSRPFLQFSSFGFHVLHFIFNRYILCFFTFNVLVQLAVLLFPVSSLIFNHLFKSSLLRLCCSLRHKVTWLSWTSLHSQ
jgi:hypothetical protein